MPHQPSIEAALEHALAAHRHSRRRFLGRAGGLALASSGLSTALAACGGVEGTAQKAKPKGDVSHPKVPLTELRFSNWPLYIDRKVLKDFERQSGLEVEYVEEVNDNTEFFGKVRQQLQSGKPTGRDLVALTDWMAARWVRNGYLEPFDRRNTPNVEAHLQPGLKDPNFDPGRRFTTPWQSGMTGIGYDKRAVGGKLTSMEQLFDPRFKGRVSMLSDARDSSSLVLLMNGVKPEEATIDQVLEAIERIERENDKGQIRRFTGNDYTVDLVKGNVVIACAYAADLIQLREDNPNLDFVIPEEGAILWSDNLMMPAGLEHPYAAEVWTNHVYDPEVAARLTATIAGVTPVTGVQEILAKTDPELAENPLVFPDDETRKRLYGYPNLAPQDEDEMNRAFEAIIGA